MLEISKNTLSATVLQGIQTVMCSTTGISLIARKSAKETCRMDGWKEARQEAKGGEVRKEDKKGRVESLGGAGSANATVLCHV